MVNIIEQSNGVKKVTIQTPYEGVTASINALTQTVSGKANQSDLDATTAQLADIAIDINNYKSHVTNNDWTNSFTQAFSDLSSKGGGRVLVPEGIFTALINIPSHCGLEGVGEKSIIQSPSNASTHTVQNNGVFITIKNLTIDGNMVNQTDSTLWALYLNSPSTGTPDSTYYNLQDSYFNVDNVKVLNGKAGNINITARGESFFNKVHALNSGGDGFYVNAPDSAFNLCSSGQNFGHGFNILGSNNRFTNVKAWNNGLNNTGLTAGYGFYLNGCMNVLVIGEAQGNLLDGVYLNSAELCTVDVFNDANGQNSGINSNGVSGFTLNNAVYNTIRGNVRNRKDRSQTKINYVLSLLGTCSDNFIDAQGLDISTGAFYDAGTNFIANKIRIRGNDVNSNKFEASTLLKSTNQSLASATSWSQINNMLPSPSVVVIEPQQIVNLLPNNQMYYGTVTISKFSASRLSVVIASEVNGVISYTGVLNNSTGNMDWKLTTNPYGKHTSNGDGTYKVTIPHGLPSTPNYVNAIASSTDATNAKISSVSADATNISVYTVNPLNAGTNNIVIYWDAKP